MKFLRKFYEPGDIWLVLAIVWFYGWVEAADRLRIDWLFGVGLVGLIIGGLQYALRSPPE